jgi:hypothetical protein
MPATWHFTSPGVRLYYLTAAELLTTDKLSELACLTLYLMYEKVRGGGWRKACTVPLRAPQATVLWAQPGDSQLRL